MVDNNIHNLLRRLPAVDELMRQPEIAELVQEHGRSLVITTLRQLLDEWRQKILTRQWGQAELAATTQEVLAGLMAKLQRQQRPNLRQVINATGVVLHTNLGRSLLPSVALEQISQVAASYSTLEVDVETGERGSRYSHVVELLKKLTGAEDALVVNNNAGAVLLALGALASGCEVIVSRGQLVEIGGSFRIPEVMEQSGCRLREVGSTNKAKVSDYQLAIGPETAALLKVHTSNYKVIGFTAEVEREELVALAQQAGLLAIEDIGSGVLIDMRKLGLSYEPTVQEAVAAGMDVVTFSGDKLLGGPQAGLIVGKKEHISLMKQHPLTRALRIDKLTLAGLEATLRLYLDEERAMREIPTLRMLGAKQADLRQRAGELLARLEPQQAAQVDVVESLAQVGGGAFPGYDIPSVALAVTPTELSSNQLEAALRLGEPAVFSRIQREQVILDLRTIQPGEEAAVACALMAALKGGTA